MLEQINFEKMVNSIGVNAVDVEQESEMTMGDRRLTPISQK